MPRHLEQREKDLEPLYAEADEMFRASALHLRDIYRLIRMAYAKGRLSKRG